MPLGVIDGTGPQASGQGVPVSGVENRGRTLPEVPTELTGYLQDRELICPDSEPVIPTELAELGRDGEQGIVGRLVGQVIQFRAGDQVPRRATAQHVRHAAADCGSVQKPGRLADLDQVTVGVADVRADLAPVILGRGQELGAFG